METGPPTHAPPSTPADGVRTTEPGHAAKASIFRPVVTERHDAVNDLMIGERLGEGALSKVYAATRAPDAAVRAEGGGGLGAGAGAHCVAHSAGSGSVDSRGHHLALAVKVIRKDRLLKAYRFSTSSLPDVSVLMAEEAGDGSSGGEGDEAVGPERETAGPMAGTLLDVLRSEIRIMATLRHAHCARLFEVLESRSKLFLVVERLQGPLLSLVRPGARHVHAEEDERTNAHSLGTTVAASSGDNTDSCPRYAWRIGRSGGDKPMPASAARHYFRGLLQGLSYMHALGVAHRDLKPENVLLRLPHEGEGSNGSDRATTLGDAVIADFGCARRYRRRPSAAVPAAVGPSAHVDDPSTTFDAMTTEPAGTPAFAPPESFATPLRRYDAFKGDVWGAGVLLFASITGRLPFWPSDFDVDPGGGDGHEESQEADAAGAEVCQIVTNAAAIYGSEGDAPAARSILFPLPPLMPQLGAHAAGHGARHHKHTSAPADMVHRHGGHDLSHSACRPQHAGAGAAAAPAAVAGSADGAEAPHFAPGAASAALADGAQPNAWPATCAAADGSQAAGQAARSPDELVSAATGISPSQADAGGRISVSPPPHHVAGRPSGAGSIVSVLSAAAAGSVVSSSSTAVQDPVARLRRAVRRQPLCLPHTVWDWCSAPPPAMQAQPLAQALAQAASGATAAATVAAGDNSGARCASTPESCPPAPATELVPAPAELLDLLTRMLDRQPATRLSAAAALQHPWLTLE
jgi:serine/threonine protein kinase